MEHNKNINISKKKAKILFIVPDVYQDDNTLPLGVSYLSSILRNQGHKVKIYSQDVYHYSNEELGIFLDNNQFDMIGVGFLAARYEETIRPLAKVIDKHKKNAKFVLGAQGVSAIPEYILKDTNADIAVIGEAENTILPLIEDILENRDLSNRKGIAFRIGDKIQVNPRQELVRVLDTIPFPAWDLFPIEQYSTNYQFVGSTSGDRFISVITSRGCINECSFCYRMEKGIRVRSMENIFEELKILNEKYKINYFMFEDEMFVPNKERIRKFVSILKDLKNPIKYSCCARVELAKDKESLKLLKESGCQLLNFGLESLDQNVLDLMGKRVRVEDNYTAVINTTNAGIHPGLNFIWGNPGDNPESLNKIVQFLLKYDTLGQLRTIRPPTPYPGCPLYTKAIKERKLEGPGDFFERFKNSDRLTVNFTDMSDTEVYNALLEANSTLIKNHFFKKGDSGIKDQEMIDSFKRVYFPKTISDMRFRGARHYNKNKLT